MEGSQTAGGKGVREAGKDHRPSPNPFTVIQELYKNKLYTIAYLFVRSHSCKIAAVPQYS